MTDHHLQEAEGDEIVRADDGRRARPKPEDALAGVAPVRDVQVLDRDVVQHVVAAAGLASRDQCALAPLVRRPHVRGARDVGDALVPEGEEVAHGELAAAQIVDADAAFVVGRAVGDPDDRGPPRPQTLDAGGHGRDGHDQHALDTLLLEHPHVRVFLGRVLVAVADDHRIARLARPVLDAARQVGEEGIRQVQQHEPDDASGAGAQMPRALVADESELVDDVEDPLARLRGHDLGAVQDVRDGADGHVRAPRDLLHGDRRSPVRRRHVRSA